MLELIYPNDPAPLVRGAGRASASEMLPIVDENGMVKAQASRAYCHSGSKVLHPVVHLHIVNREGKIYIQQRSASKDLLPLKWDTTVGGHISYGEWVVEALFREASKELHFHDFHPIWITSYVFESKVEKELVNVFATVGDFHPVPDGEEVAAGRYWSPEEIEAKMGKGVFTPNFEQEYRKISVQLQALL